MILFANSLDNQRYSESRINIEAIEEVYLFLIELIAYINNLMNEWLLLNLSTGIRIIPYSHLWFENNQNANQ